MVRTVPRCVDKTCTKTETKRAPPVPFTTEQLRKLFWRFDTNRDRRLSRKELKAAFNHLGAIIPDWRAHRALNHADDNGDGYISEEEFDKLLNYAVKLGYVLK